MDKPSFDLGESPPSSDQEQVNLLDSRLLSIKGHILQLLEHASKCCDANCSQYGCQKMKIAVQHTNSCKQKNNGCCNGCKQFIALCCYHAKLCKNTMCPVPFCVNNKHKLPQQRISSTNRQKPSEDAIKSYMQLLVHACQCRDPNCRLPRCQKMKLMVRHTNSCKQGTKGGCNVCKQVMALYSYHAQNCEETSCQTPFCILFKYSYHFQNLQAQPTVGQLNPKQRKLMRQLLELLLHARMCLQWQNQHYHPNVRCCPLLHCQTMKTVLNHITTCQVGTSCKEMSCVSSQQIMSHWTNCSSNDCRICVPLKKTIRMKPPPQGAGA